MNFKLINRLINPLATLSLLAWLLALPMGAQPPESINTAPTSPLLANPPQAASDYFHLQKKIFRWSDQTKFVLVHISTASYIQGWQPWHPQVIKDAFGEWQRALNNRVVFVFMDDTTQTDMVVNWWAMATPQIERGACGLNIKQTWGNYISKNDIYMALHNADGRPYNPQTLYAAALHEIGHSLGIEEHSDQASDIMYYATTEKSRLSQRDINTAFRIYAARPHFTNPPGYHLSRFEAFKKTRKAQSGGFRIPIIIPIPI
ncbi:matrixin family metalloprotease [Vampirovibrio sp.]|uniref:matrixin family metalloprotease n=1 Tax=Vampirovibrio sp. TaxID=2717857 RepID=UPI0035933364